jgi:hypothetical protein
LATIAHHEQQAGGGADHLDLCLTGAQGTLTPNVYAVSVVVCTRDRGARVVTTIASMMASVGVDSLWSKLRARGIGAVIAVRRGRGLQ